MSSRSRREGRGEKRETDNDRQKERKASGKDG